MKMFLISDNVDTQTGMRLAGVDGVVVHAREELRQALEAVLADKEVGIILLTEKFGREFPEIIDDVRLNHKVPLIIEIPTGTVRAESGLYHILCERSNRIEIVRQVKDLTTEEKLENFYNHSIESAKSEAERMIEEYQAALDRLFAEHQKQKQEQTAEELAAEKENLKRENNKALSAEQLQIKRSLSAKSMEIEKKIFDQVEEKLLRAFRDTPEYITYLCGKIKKDIEFAGGSEIQFYLDASDEGIREKGGEGNRRLHPDLRRKAGGRNSGYHRRKEYSDR